MDAGVPLKFSPKSNSLLRQRDFQILWIGQLGSSLGSNITGIAMPLLVLAVTGSPVKAGITGFAFAIPLVLFSIPAGVWIDRMDRKRVMWLTECTRFIAFSSLVFALLFWHLIFAHILLVTFIDGAGAIVFWVAERSSMRQIVPEELLPNALTQTQAREFAALLAGQPLGGLLFSIGRAVPFAFDAVSYLLSMIAISFIRTPLQEERAPVAARQHIWREAGKGIAFLWNQPFLRMTSLLVAGVQLVESALYLAVIVIAKGHGASSATIGLMFGFVGIGGLLGAAIAPTLAKRMNMKKIVMWTVSIPAFMLPLLIVLKVPLLMGVVYGFMFILFPTWVAVVSAYRLMVTPDELQGRVQSASGLLNVSAVPFSMLGVGVLLHSIGGTKTVAILAILMAIIAVIAIVSPSVRNAPTAEEAAAAVVRRPPMSEFGGGELESEVSSS